MGLVRGWGNHSKLLRSAFGDGQKELRDHVQNFGVLRVVALQIEKGDCRCLVFPTIHGAAHRGHQRAVFDLLFLDARRQLLQKRKRFFAASLRRKVNALLNESGFLSRTGRNSRWRARRSLRKSWRGQESEASQHSKANTRDLSRISRFVLQDTALNICSLSRGSILPHRRLSNWEDSPAYPPSVTSICASLSKKEKLPTGTSFVSTIDSFPGW